MKRPANMTDVAEALGCHQSTVSRALRNDPRISTKMRDQILKTCDELSYRPNPLVSALIASRRKKSNTHIQAQLAYVTRNPHPGPIRSGSYMEEIFKACQKRAEELGYLLHEVPILEKGENPQRIQRMFKARGIYGAVLGSMAPGTEPFAFPWEQYPLVAIGYGLTSPEIYRVATNNYESTYRAMEECSSRDYRRIGFVISPYENARSRGLEIGGYMACQMNFPPECRVPLLIAKENETSRIQEWVAQEKPDAIITSQPIQMLEVCRALDMSCPVDVGIIALGNVQDPFFTKMERAFDIIGRLAAELVIRRVERNEIGIPEHPGQYLISPRWIEGKSIREKGA
ncbi:LacI family DNA-binding transcriptional regulator [Cerasicoccus frondis]|uniref:LacI family DNA-binding transcriptional regulator n=1 Tax=Cerasicoccus frondis TaxID=490090 RepID=UPI00285279A8|nr:LacI family DNA-binding transcriptional regulator [Cerasicoccus frondis]